MKHKKHVQRKPEWQPERADEIIGCNGCEILSITIANNFKSAKLLPRGWKPCVVCIVIVCIVCSTKIKILTPNYCNKLCSRDVMSDG